MQWLSFTARKNRTVTELKWKTSDEQNVQQFIVQNSTDAINWNNISTVNAHNNKSINDYSYTHTNPAEGINFYRIQEKESSGKISYSEIESLQFNEDKIEFTVVINPVNNGVLTIKIHSAIMLSLFDYSGKLLWRKNEDPSIEVIDMNKLPKGIYFLKSPEQTTKILLQ